MLPTRIQSTISLPPWLAMAGAIVWQVAMWIWDPPLAKGRAPTRTTIAVALAVEAGIILWLAVSMPVPWPLAIGLAASVAAVLAVAVATGPRSPSARWPGRARFALGLALVLDVLLITFMGLLLFLILADGSIARSGLVPFLIAPIVLGFAVYANVGIGLTLSLSLLLILSAGVLMGTGPLAFLAVPLVLTLGVIVVIFEAISPTPAKELRIGRIR